MGSQAENERNASPEKEERGRSTIEFTYASLDDSEELVGAVRALGGTGCSLDGLAAKLNQSPTGGGFRLKVYSARTFGLCDMSRGQVTLTDLGLRIIDGSHVRAARIEAFLNVPLYQRMYEQLKGQQLPPMAAIERMMEAAGVAPKQKERARQVFIRSAKFAGFFDIQADRLVKPELRDASPGAVAQPMPATDMPVATASPPLPRVFYGGGGDGGDGIHPAILGLLRELPSPGTPLTSRRKDQLKAAFASNIDFIYPDPEDVA
jgi:hypothetical protein